MRDLPPGKVLRQYRIVKVLGSGGFGVTYLAKDETLDKLFAIKEYFPDDFAERKGSSIRARVSRAEDFSWGKSRFIDEARTLARFKHRNIVEVMQVFEENSTAYMVLAYEKGRHVSEWLKEIGDAPNQLELDHVVEPILDALDVVHRNDLLHRDVSPDNIIIRDDGTPVLIDFGSARDALAQRTKAVSAIVKSGYSPPEQYSTKGTYQGPWTDIYSLAATLYHAVTGARPEEATERLLTDNYVSAKNTTKAEYRPTFLEAIDWGLKLTPKDRPQSIAEWRDALLAKPKGKIPKILRSKPKEEKSKRAPSYETARPFERGKESVVESGPPTNDALQDLMSEKQVPQPVKKAPSKLAPKEIITSRRKDQKDPYHVGARAAVLLLMILAIPSALLSAYSPIEPWGALQFDLFKKQELLPGVYFALVLSAGVYFWESKNWKHLLLVFAGVLFSWICAYQLANQIHDMVLGVGATKTSRVALALSGIGGGGIGSALVALSIACVSKNARNRDFFIRTIIVGTLAGTLLVFLIDLKPRNIILFLVWQPAVAASVAYQLVRSKSVIYFPARQEMALIVVAILVLGGIGLFFKQQIDIKLAKEQADYQNTVRQETAEYNRAQGNIGLLKRYHQNCTICEFAVAVFDQILALERQAADDNRRKADVDTQKKRNADAEESLYRAAQGDIGRLRDYWRNCKICEFRDAARTAIEKIEKEEGDSYRAARDNISRLRDYLLNCKSCTFREFARQDIIAIEKADESSFRTARGNVDLLNAYLRTCKTCAFRSSAEKEIVEIEEEKSFRSARDNIGRLKDYLRYCKICKFRDSAQTEIASLESEEASKRLAAQEERTYRAAQRDLGRLKDYIRGCRICAFRAAAQDEITALEKQLAQKYVVNGIALGSRVDSSTPDYRDYKCGPSEQFAHFTYCERKREEKDLNNNPFNSTNSILHGGDGIVAYVSRYLIPAFFKPGEAENEIDRLSKKFGEKARIFRIPKKPDLPDSVIALWGEVQIEELDQASIALLAKGQSPKKGFLVEYVGSFPRSAQAGLPVYRITGGPGFLWSASFDLSGRGHLRFSAVNPSAYLPNSETTIAKPNVPSGVGGPLILPSGPNLASALKLSMWNHNGSMVSLKADGLQRNFFYEIPKAEMLAVGVKSGTLLFSGKKEGDHYSGTAYTFSANCGILNYTVSGPISSDQRQVTLRGKAPRVDSNCRVADYREDELVFTFDDGASIKNE